VWPLFESCKHQLHRDLDKRAGAYAKQNIDRLLDLEKKLRRFGSYPSELGSVFYMALVRAKVPIEASWEVFLPFCGETDAMALEGARALRDPKRAARLLARKVADDRSGFAGQLGLKILAFLPSAELTDAVLDRCERALKPPVSAQTRRNVARARAKLASLAKRRPVIAQRLAARWTSRSRAREPARTGSGPEDVHLEASRPGHRSVR